MIGPAHAVGLFLRLNAHGRHLPLSLKNADTIAVISALATASFNTGQLPYGCFALSDT